MKKILLFLLIICLLHHSNLFAQLLNPGFESETGTTVTDWIDNGSGTESVGTINARTGTNALSYATSSTSNQDMRSVSSISVADNDYVHVIGWAIGNNENALASVGIFMGSYNNSAGRITIGTTLTQLSFKTRNTQLSTQNAIGKLNSSTGSGAVILYWDDIVIYTSSSSTTDLVDPNYPSSLSLQSNPGGTSMTITWTDGTDASTGSKEAVILRANGLAQSPIELNDQGRYSISGGTNGPNTVGIWTVIGIVNAGVQAYIDNSISPNTNYTYAVYMRDEAYNYSTAAAISITAFLVELSTFSAICHGNAVNLKWQTKTEVENYGFDVERRQTSNVKSETWNKIGFVNGYGNSNSPKEYNFVDNSISSGKYLYRLKQIDTDGKYEFSKEVEVDLGTPKTFYLGQNYPNPFNPSTKINYSLPVDGEVKLALYTLEGELVNTLVNERQNAGNYSVEFNAENLSSGMYIYKLISNGFVQTKKMMLAK